MNTSVWIRQCRSIRSLCLRGLSTLFFAGAADSFAEALYIHGEAGTAEAKHLVKLITDYGASAADLEKALYQGIDLNRVIRYCNNEKEESIPGNSKQFKRCYTPLGVACAEMGRSGKEERDSILLEKMYVLVEHGASVAEDPPVMFHAIIGNRLDIVKSTLQKGVNVNALRARVSIQLQFQNRGYVIAVISPIERKTCDENEFRIDRMILDTSGYMYPIHAAAAAGSHEMVDLLLSYGADCSLKDNFGQTVTDWALARGDRDQYVFRRIQECLPQTEHKGHHRFITAGVIGIILLLTGQLLRWLLRLLRECNGVEKIPGGRVPGVNRTGAAAMRPVRKTVADPKGPVTAENNGMVFSLTKPSVAKKGFSLADRSHFTLFVSLLPCVFYGVVVYLSKTTENLNINMHVLTIIAYVNLAVFFSWLWAVLVSIRFVIDDVRKAEGSFTWVGYAGVTITVILLITWTVFLNRNSLRLGWLHFGQPVLTTAVPLRYPPMSVGRADYGTFRFSTLSFATGKGTFVCSRT